MTKYFSYKMGNCSNCQPPAIITTQVGTYEYKSTQLIGSGTYGTVHKGQEMGKRKKNLAIKCLHRTFTLQEYQNIQRYLKKLQSVYGENILTIFDHYYDENTSKLYLISDYYTYGNLNDLIIDTLKADPLEDLRTAIEYCHQIIHGLIDLHSQGVIHGKLTPKNILLQCSRLVLNDYGLAPLAKEEDGRKRKTIYDAPELMEEHAELTEKCDVWSLGIIMYHLIYKNNPIKILGKEYIFYNLQEGKCPVADDLIRRCLAINPEERISLREIEGHEFLTLNPQSIEYLPAKWFSAKSTTPSSTHAAYKMFHQMEINYNFASM